MKQGKGHKMRKENPMTPEDHTWKYLAQTELFFRFPCDMLVLLKKKKTERGAAEMT